MAQGEALDDFLGSSAGSQILSIPQPGDSLSVILRKLDVITAAITSNRSVAIATQYAYTPTGIARSEMSPVEANIYAAFQSGSLDYQLGLQPLPDLKFLTDVNC